MSFRHAVAACMVGVFTMISSAWPLPAQAEEVDFNRDIRPIFNNRCVACHGGVKRSSGLSLLFRDEALKVHDSGHPGITPGRPDESELIARITHPDPDERMPPQEEALGAGEIESIIRWVREGALWADHWAYIKPGAVTPPDVPDSAGVRNDIDRFVLDRLHQEGLTPSPEADRATLLRRVSLDLTGLPPSPDQIQEFVKENTRDAYERVVDRLLASPHYGERWAGMWLDLARYADTKGYEADRGRTIWRYRDWLIEAFNRDLPYDRFTVEQLAGDLLPNATSEQILATALHRNTMTNDEGGTDDEEYRIAAVMDRVNTTWEIWMGTTFSCVQCHGHPYDPFIHEDYYRFFAFLNNTADADRPDDAPTRATYSPPQRERRTELEARKLELEAQLNRRAASPELASTYRDWLQRLTPRSVWSPLRAPRASSRGGATLQVMDDGRIVSNGANPDEDVLTIVSQTDLEHLTGIRLESLPHPDFQNRGAGRSSDGNFVLSGITVRIRQPDAAPVRARYVRIDLPGPGKILSLAEVQVLGAGTNFALTGSALQSSTDYEGDAARAIDNDTNGQYDRGSTTHSRTEDSPWWELDLRQEQNIEQVVIWHRTDNLHFSRSNGMEIRVLNATRKPVRTYRIDEATHEAHTLALNEVVAPIASAYADHAQDGFPVTDAIRPSDPRRQGWAVAPHIGQPHQAVFLLEQPLRVPEKAEVSIHLHHRFHQGQFSLGNFRLALSDAAELASRASLPAAILSAVSKPETQRSREDRKALLRAFAAEMPALSGTAAALAGIERDLSSIASVATPVLSERPADQRRPTHILERGNWLAPGAEVTPGVPSVLPPLPEGASLDRLGMAQWMVSPDHPLTARVAVNRFWEQLFGAGLVVSLEDFGTQGEKPSHPELLDWLAGQLVHEHGWSIKQALKQMVMSATYRQASSVSPDLLDRDPYNRLLARGPRFRLSAEQIRDQALAASGLLNPTLFGPSVMPPQPANLWQSVYSGDSWKDASGEDRYRRALYTYWKRTSPYPSMTTFDAPSREVCVTRRIRTNTPLQALVTLNDPVYVEAARALAERMQTEGGSALRERIGYGFRLVQARAPAPEDVNDMAALFEDARLHFVAQPDRSRILGGDSERAALTLVASALLNLDATLTRE